MLPRVHFHEQLVYGYVTGMLTLREREDFCCQQYTFVLVLANLSGYVRGMLRLREIYRCLVLPVVHCYEQLGLASLWGMSEECR